MACQTGFRKYVCLSCCVEKGLRPRWSITCTFYPASSVQVRVDLTPTVQNIATKRNVLSQAEAVFKLLVIGLREKEN